MPGLFEALSKVPPQKKKVHTVTIQGQSIVVTLEKKLEVIRHGEDAYHWINEKEFTLKPKPKPRTQYPVLKKSEKGYGFEQGDIHWPTKIEPGGEAWLIEHE